MTLPTENTSIPLAIIGMACRLPGAANLDEYWNLIVEGRSSIVEMPPERLEREIYYNPEKGTRGHTYSSKASLLADRTFHRDRCPLPDEIVNSVDSTHLLMTEVAADALRHAGLDPFQLPLRNTSVFIGHAQGSRRVGDLVYDNHLEEAIGMLEATAEFQKLPAAEQTVVRDELVATLKSRIPVGPDRMRFLTCNMVAGTIAKAFGLTGSWLALNSACASSLHAMLMGARALQTGRADMVIVGGASDCKSESLVLFSNAQTLSPTGSRPFDSEADGLVMAEGFVCLVMKTLDRAIADGDPIQAVVRGLGVATDGRGKSLWAPRKEGQIKAMRRAYRAGVDMAGLQYIECHATATQLGDATELETIGEVLKSVFPAGKRIPITSVKANIGHALESAGMAGMIKAIMCMQHKMFPAAINIREFNPKVDWASAPFHVPQQSAVWEAPADGGPRRAAVNAFGIGGLNMHVVIDEATPQNTTRQVPQPVKLGTPEDRSIAIIGMGCILPGAAEIGELWQTVSSGADPKCAPPADRWPARVVQKTKFNGPAIHAGFITDYKYDWRKHKVPPKQVAEADPLQFMLLDGSEQAMKDTGYELAAIDRELCGVVVGSEFGGEFSDQVEIGLRLVEIQFFLRQQMLARGYSIEQIEAINTEFGNSLLKRWPALLDEAGSFTTSTLASRISKSLDLNGGAVAIDSGSTSAMNAMMLSIDSLLSGDTNLMICASGQRRMSPTAFLSLRQVNILADQQPARSVLDAGYNGVVPGEGVGVLVLKRLADARKDNDRIRAVIRGVGIASHASPGEAVRLAMHRACAVAGVSPADINFLEIDTDEAAVDATDLLAALASDHALPDRQVPAAIGSATAQFGHLGGAAPMVAMLKAGLEVQQGQVAPVFGLQQAAGSITGSQGIQAARQQVALTDSRLGAVVSWSKGQAFYVILDDGKPIAPKPKRPAVVQNQQPVASAAKNTAAKNIVQSAAASASLASICRFGAKSLPELQTEFAAVLADPAAGWTRSIARPFANGDCVRLAIVADDAVALARKLKLASTQLNNAAAQQVLEQQGVFYRELLATRPRVVFVFPGQGSQYDGMLRDLVGQSPAAARAMLECNAAMQKFGYPTLAELAWNTPTQLGTNVWHTQAAMLLADIICLAAVRERGIEPDLVLGHSYGEFPALYAAGVWDLETVIQMTWARCAGITAVASSQAGLLATNAPPEEIKRLIAASGAQAYLANFNAPDQTVVGGKRPQLETLQAALAGAGHTVRMLDVPAAFHTPLMAGASRQLQQGLETAAIASPKLQVISTVDNRLVSNADDVRRNLGVQLTTSVRYAPLIEELAAERPTVFVEIGPQQTLTKLNRRILPSGGAAIASDNPKRAGVEPLLCVQAFLECLGVEAASAKTPSSVSAATQPVMTQPGMTPTKSISSVTPVPAVGGQTVAPAAIRPLAPSPTLSKGVPNDSAMDDDIPHFDATERRRSKMRSASDQHAPPGANGLNRAPDPPSPAPSAAPLRVAPVAAVPPPKPVAQPAPAPAPVMAAPVPPKPVAAPAAPVAEQKQTTSTNPADLEKFLVSFVVEQTGYPPEVVELDADLEADLGIDSIKKAQLFGELSEYFDIGGVSATELSLDDFPTLRHVLNFLASSEQAPAASVAAAPAVAPVAQAPQPVVPVQAAAPVAPPAPVQAASPVAAAVPATAELESFLVNFVVEQTGYPPEVVELDADLEADLGIDSIKKAQLFGELSEYFDIGGVSATELSLDDFPTLRHVLNFLAASAPASAAAAPAAPVPPAAPVQAVASVAPPAPVPVAAPVAAIVPATAELESFLVNFVVEQTGYPPEVVELDADLEADLGIDSIKKAQLFGELSEYFDIGGVSATELSLDDFPTLRHVLNFLAASSAASAGSPAGNESASFSQAAPAPALEQIDREIAPAAAPGQPSLAPAAESVNDFHANGVAHANGNGKAHAMFSESKEANRNGAARSGDKPVIVVGTPYEMGWQHGSQFQAAIRKILRTYTEFVGQSLDELPGAAECRQAQAVLSADVLDELQGIADGVGVPLANILAHHFAISSYASEEAEFSAAIAQHSDSGELTHSVRHKGPLFGALKEARTPVVLLRKPARGIPAVAVTLVGTTTVLAGVNVAGIAISADRGALANSVSRTVLEQASDLDAALKFASRHTSANWSACISDARADRIASVTCDGATMNIRSDEPTLSTTGWAPQRGQLLSTASGELPTTSVRATALLNPNSLTEEIVLAEGELLITLELSAGKISLHQATDADRQQQIDYRSLLPEWTEAARLQHLRFLSPPASNASGPLAAPVVTSRFVCDMQAAPLPPTAAAEFSFTGAAIVLGAGETAAALEKLLVARQVPVYRLSTEADLDTTLAQLEQICSAGPAPHLFITGVRDLAPATVQNEAAFDAQRMAVMEAPLFLCQQWLMLATTGKWLDRCTLVATTAMGGDFGFAAGSSAPQGGALAGLLKGIFIEYAFLQGFTGLRVKVIDAPDETPAEEVAANALRELASRDPDYEVAWSGSHRHVPRASLQPLADANQANVRHGATWVVTGGARGITAACALELGKRYGLKLHLLGTTPLPNIDPAWRNLSAEGLQKLKSETILAARKAGQPAPTAWERVQKQIEMDRSFRSFEAAGVAATYHVCDVSNRASVAQVLDAVCQQDGPIEGILHGAGIDKSCRFEKKQRDVVSQTIRTKVDGAAHLMALTRRDPVRHFIGFGSISGRFGNFGQADYCLASEMLCKLVGAYRRERPWIRAVGIHWHGWDEVGMAAKPEMKSLLEGKSDVALMPLAEGIGHLVRELEAGLPVREVVFTQQTHWERFASGMDGLLKQRGAAAGEGQSSSAYAKPATPNAAAPVAAPPKAFVGAAVQKTLAEVEPVELRTERCQLRTVVAPLPAGSPKEPVFTHAVWILGENTLACELKQRLEARGVRVRQFSAAGDLDQLQAELAQAWNADPAGHLFLLTGRDEVAGDLLSTSEIERRRHQGIIVPYFVAQTFLKLLHTKPELGQGTIAAAVSLGGDFGFSGQPVLPEGGGVAGFLKAVYIENSRSENCRVRCKVIDAPPNDSPAQGVDALLREIAAHAPEVEVAWTSGVRHVVRPVAAPLSGVTSASIPRGGVWVVTGGARGITAITAREMARRYGWKLHLLGTSPAPQADAIWRNYNAEQLKQFKSQLTKEALAAGKSPSEAWERVQKDNEIYKNLQEFVAAGAQAEYHQCNVTDGPAVARLLEAIRQQDGPITGLIYGAGIIAPCKFETNRRVLVEKLVRIKVDGLMNVLSALRNDPLTHCIGFGSISGRFGANGLTDYAAGNDAMVKILDWYRGQRPECKSFSFHWEQWEGAGVAMIPRLAWGPRSVMNMKYMQPVEGVRRVEEELGAGVPEAEVLPTFGEFYPMFYPLEQRPLNTVVETAPKTMPMIIASRQTEQGWQGDVALHPTVDQFLVEHTLRNKPILPVVIGLETLAEAATLASGMQVVGFENIEMIDGLYFHTDSPVVAQVTVSNIGANEAIATLTCDFRNRAGGLIQKDRPYLRAKAELATSKQPLSVSLPPLPTEWRPLPYPEKGLMYNGTPFRCFEALSAVKTEGWSKLTALPMSGLVGTERARGWLLPSCVFDAAMFGCGAHQYVFNERAHTMPKHIDRVQLGRLPRDGEACYVYFQVREMSAKTNSYDFTIVGEDLGVIVQVTGYHKFMLLREGAK